MFAHAGLSGGQSGFGVKRGAVPLVHLRGSGDRDIEQVVGGFLTCRSQNPESRGINSARIFCFALKVIRAVLCHVKEHPARFALQVTTAVIAVPIFRAI
jgi:hypothetical protein